MATFQEFRITINEFKKSREDFQNNQTNVYSVNGFKFYSES